MARILIIQNTHPDEANAIRVSSMVARRLEAIGHKVFIRKFRFAETGQGVVFRAGRGEKISKSPKDVAKMFYQDSPEHRKKITEWLGETKPNFAFDFHCSERRTFGSEGFFVDRRIRYGVPNVRTVEVGAEFKPLPKKHRRILNRGFDALFKEKPLGIMEIKDDYLKRTTSWRKSARRKELNPERLVSGITMEINNIARKLKPINYGSFRPRAKPRELAMRKRVRK